MHLQHERQKMGAPLLEHRCAGEEQVHQHGLPAPDSAKDIEPLVRRGLMGEAEALAPARPAEGEATVAGKRVVQRLEFFCGQQLGRIGFQPALDAPPPIGGQWSFGRRDRAGRLLIHRPPATLRIAPVI